MIKNKSKAEKFDSKERVKVGQSEEQQGAEAAVSKSGSAETSPSDFIDLKELIDNADVMTSLHMSRRTLQKYRTEGMLPYLKIGGKIFYKRRDLEKLLARNYRIGVGNNRA